MKEVNQISLATDRPVISPHSYECMSVQLIFLARLRPVHVSSRSRHPRARLHNTSLYAATVRWTLIIYLLQFCLFSSIFHNSSPRHPSRSPYRTAAGKKSFVRVCIGRSRPLGRQYTRGAAGASWERRRRDETINPDNERRSRPTKIHLDILMQLSL